MSAKVIQPDWGQTIGSFIFFYSFKTSFPFFGFITF